MAIALPEQTKKKYSSEISREPSHGSLPIPCGQSAVPHPHYAERQATKLQLPGLAPIWYMYQLWYIEAANDFHTAKLLIVSIYYYYFQAQAVTIY